MPRQGNDDRAEISCNSCRERKIRCNRVRPTCDKCQSLGSECAYPARKQRSKRALSTEEALKNIFDRLERLESTVANAISNGTLQQDRHEQQQPIRLERDQLGSSSPPGAASSCTDSTGSPFLRTETLAVDRTYKRSPSSSPSEVVRTEDTIQSGSPSLTELVSEATNLARAVLSVKAPETASCPSRREEAAVLDSLQKVETETAGGKNKIATSKQALMPSNLEMQRWLELFFSQAPEYYLFSFRATFPDEFVWRIPQLINRPDDVTCMLSYYSLAHQGLALDDSDIPNRVAYIEGLYMACLNILEPWKKKKSSFTMLDVVTSLSMTIFAWKFLDNNLANSIFKHGCTVARRLGLFHIDDPTYVHSPPLTEDQKAMNRFLFWQIYQFNSGFSLQAGEPSAIADGTWMVEMPAFSSWMHDKMYLTSEHHITFIAVTRLALVQKETNAVLVKAAAAKKSRAGHDVSEQLKMTLASLVTEVQTIMEELSLAERYATATELMSKQYYGDILFNFHTTLTLLYRAGYYSAIGPCAPDPALHSARTAINTMRELHDLFPSGRHWNIGFVCFYPFIPFFTLFCNLLVTDDLAAARSDLALINWLQQTISDWSSSRASVGLERFEVITRRLNEVGLYFLSKKCAEQQEPEVLMNDALNLEFDFDIGQFLDRPVEYARMLETGVVQADTHAAWWSAPGYGGQ